MTVSVEFHFDFGSPNAYLAHLAIPGVEARTGVRFKYVPVLLGGVFKATNNVSPAVSLKGIRNKPEYQRLETERFLRQYGVPAYVPNPHFPVNTLTIMRGAIVAEREGFFECYVDEVYRHMWARQRKMDDPTVIAQALDGSGLPGDWILACVQDPAVKQQLIANTESAVERGVFGSPSFFVGEELYFGKDKLRDVEEELARQQS
ncbi:MAG: 2-hydroxychromene-2-carboxylate isomerase [Gammaproteobacteria bacterium]|nr:2-hydroxychromene-2-carboxylate isomerase [Gammaproteobacteria bacterium]